jgi:hypothetical protein
VHAITGSELGDRHHAPAWAKKAPAWSPPARPSVVAQSPESRTAPYLARELGLVG